MLDFIAREKSKLKRTAPGENAAHPEVMSGTVNGCSKMNMAFLIGDGRFGDHSPCGLVGKCVGLPASGDQSSSCRTLFRISSESRSS